MSFMLWLIAIGALLLAVSASRRAAALTDQVDELRRGALLGEGSAEEVTAGLDVLRKQVARLAGGQPVTRDMVMEKRLHANASASDLQQQLESGEALHVVDVRSDSEWSGGHIQGAMHIPMDHLEQRLHEVPRDGKPLFLVCAGGGRSGAAAEFLAGRGYLNLHNVEGGMGAWRGEVTRDGEGVAGGS